jgi:hypothetical protein
MTAMYIGLVDCKCLQNFYRNSTVFILYRSIIRSFNFGHLNDERAKIPKNQMVKFVRKT